MTDETSAPPPVPMPSEDSIERAASNVTQMKTQLEAWEKAQQSRWFRIRNKLSKVSFPVSDVIEAKLLGTDPPLTLHMSDKNGIVILGPDIRLEVDLLPTTKMYNAKLFNLIRSTLLGFIQAKEKEFADRVAAINAEKREFEDLIAEDVAVENLEQSREPAPPPPQGTETRLFSGSLMAPRQIPPQSVLPMNFNSGGNLQPPDIKEGFIQVEELIEAVIDKKLAAKNDAKLDGGLLDLPADAPPAVQEIPAPEKKPSIPSVLKRLFGATAPKDKEAD